MKKNVLRGGIGLFSTTYTDGLGGTLASQPPNSFTPSGLNAGYVGTASDPNSAEVTAATSAAAFLSGFAKGDTLAQLQAAVAPAKFTTPSLTTYPNTYDLAHSLEWNFELQHEFNSHNSLSINYVGNKSTQLSNTINLNEFACTVVQAYCTAANSQRYYGGAYGGLPTAPLDPRFVSITQTVFNGYANFSLADHSAPARIRLRVNRSVPLHLGPRPRVPTGTKIRSTSRAAMAAWAPTSGIRRSVVLWNQPFKTGNKFINQIVVGWTVGLKAYFYSGQPFSVTDSNLASHINSSGVTAGLADLIVPSRDPHILQRQYRRQWPSPVCR